jgi:hypothetical protein
MSCLQQAFGGEDLDQPGECSNMHNTLQCIINALSKKSLSFHAQAALQSRAAARARVRQET